jgi:hypothetical protein
MATDLVDRPGDDALYVSLRDGTVYRIDLDLRGRFRVPNAAPQPVLDLRNVTSVDGERGLLGLEFDSSGDHLVTVSTAIDGAVVVRSFPVDRRGTPDATGVRVLAEIPHPFASHNGGDVVRLRDGDLVLGLGDMDTADEPRPAAQDSGSVLGSIVRLPRALVAADVSASWPTPADVIAKGLRNPWRLALDPDDGSVWIGDVGDQTVEEIDHLTSQQLSARPTPPVNFGWPWFEGTLLRRRGPEPGTPIGPIHEYRHGAHACGVVLGPVLPALPAPATGAQLLFGDLCSRDVWAMATGGTHRSRLVARLAEPPVSFGTDGRQAYALSASGRVERLDPRSWRVGAVEAAVPGPPTTVEPTAPVQSCDVVAAFTELGTQPYPTPARFRELIASATRALEEADASLRGSFGLDTTPIHRVLTDIAAVGERTGWQRSSPEYAALEAAVRSGAPPYQQFGTSLARLQDLSDPACRPQGAD